ncbi:MAG: hypothetical protein MUD01_08000 [Chloroflexaceae bacterium]|jgi:DNA-binding NarL/FixJ family response regulator|nr:hypothetical protein [Chloroflexaceae bacterium]
MKPIVVVDFPHVADFYQVALQQHLGAEVLATSRDPTSLAPPGALLLIESRLEETRPGLCLADQLHTTRPDLNPLVWTLRPTPLELCAATRLHLPGFLDKALPAPELFRHLQRLDTDGTAWPRDLLERARAYEEETAQRLGQLSPLHWQLWLALVNGDDTAQLLQAFAWSRRTLNRRLDELYAMLGVAERQGALRAAGR